MNILWNVRQSDWLSYWLIVLFTHLEWRMTRGCFISSYNTHWSRDWTFVGKFTVLSVVVSASYRLNKWFAFWKSYLDLWIPGWRKYTAAKCQMWLAYGRAARWLLRLEDRCTLSLCDWPRYLLIARLADRGTLYDWVIMLVTVITH
jgi:hypothetical protein